MLLNLLLNNLPASLEEILNCGSTYFSIQLNVFIQTNTYDIHSYVQKSIENSFLPKINISEVFLNLLGNFKTDVAYKRLAYKKAM